MTNCGAGGETCCTSLEVEGGTYYRTYDPLGDDGGIELAPDGGASGEANPASVSTFRLDKYEVTVGRFRQFVAAWNGGGGWRPDAGSGKHGYLNGGLGLVNSADNGYEPGWVISDDVNVAPTDKNLDCDSSWASTWTDPAGENEKLPINCINWWESYAFCIYDGGFLPSESEWEYAAAGGSQQREFPWGGAAPGATNQYAIYGDGNDKCYYPAGTLTTCTGLANLAPVGFASLGAGAWGQLDLAGNVYELTLDTKADYVVPCADCAYMTLDSTKEHRGGNFYYPASLLLSADRDNWSPPAGYRSHDIGFRCARAP